MKKSVLLIPDGVPMNVSEGKECIMYHVFSNNAHINQLYVKSYALLFTTHHGQ